MGKAEDKKPAYMWDDEDDGSRDAGKKGLEYWAGKI